MESLIHQHTYARSPLRSFADGEYQDVLKMPLYAGMKCSKCLHKPCPQLAYTPSFEVDLTPSFEL
jgi:hypothetical protein